MKWYSNIISILIGLFFVYAGVMKYLMPVQETDTLAWQGQNELYRTYYMLLQNTGYMGFVAVCQILLGVMLIYRKTRLLAAIMFVPLLVNLICTHIFISHNIPNLVLDIVLLLLVGSLIAPFFPSLKKTILA